jgi:UDP-N-acetylmuramate dehydrogenase
VTESLDFDVAGIADQLAGVAGTEVKTDEMIAPYTSYKIGGPASIWAAPVSEDGVGEVLAIVRETDIPLFILGLGSNLLVSDKGWPGVILYLGANLSEWRFDGTAAIVMAGTRLLDLIQDTVDQGLGGMELMAGIPGSVGGALRMNAGAFGQEIEQTTVKVKGFQLDGSPFEAGRNDILALRAKKQPLDYPSCGSVFKRPPGYYAGALIEEAGLKGERVGDAMVSPKHAGFILNTGNADAADVFSLIRRIEDRVWERFGVKLEREVKLIGEFND